jgi:hypothetical protein
MIPVIFVGFAAEVLADGHHTASQRMIRDVEKIEGVKNG